MKKWPGIKNWSLPNVWRVPEEQAKKTVMVYYKSSIGTENKLLSFLRKANPWVFLSYRLEKKKKNWIKPQSLTLCLQSCFLGIKIGAIKYLQ